jgi:nicotinamide-nucleotide amidase
MTRVEIVTVGNEILLGDVLDSNSNWICRQITGLGGQVERVVTVRDEADTISREIKSALSRDAKLIFTLGGLGPTADDLTLEGVARATDCPLELSEGALAFVRSRYEYFYREGSVDSPELTETRRKMAILPKGAEPLANNVGAAPGVLLRLENGRMIISLPGVPSETKDIFSNSLSSVLHGVFGSGLSLERSLTTDARDESVLSPVLSQVSGQFSDVYVKSRAKRFGTDVRFRITLSARGESHEAIHGRLDDAHRALEAALAEQGIRILEVNE